MAHGQICSANGNRHHLAALCAGLAVMCALVGARAAELRVGMPAPDFSLTDQNGETHSVADYRGRWLVVYFYPRDDTPGCTKEACAFRDDIRALRQMQVALLGISLDSIESHRKFAQKHGLPFPLLADTDGAVAASYGALWSLGPLRFARRHSFIIDPQGRVAHIYRDVNAGEHSDEVIGDLTALGAGSPREAAP
jgi:peroxiredoxin Q/BCP